MSFFNDTSNEQLLQIENRIKYDHTLDFNKLEHLKLRALSLRRILKKENKEVKNISYNERLKKHLEEEEISEEGLGFEILDMEKYVSMRMIKNMFFNDSYGGNVRKLHRKKQELRNNFRAIPLSTIKYRYSEEVMKKKKRECDRECLKINKKIKQLRMGGEDTSQEDLNELLENFEEYKQQRPYLILENMETEKNVFIPLAKKGNDSYAYRLAKTFNKKFSFLDEEKAESKSKYKKIKNSIEVRAVELKDLDEENLSLLKEDNKAYTKAKRTNKVYVTNVAFLTLTYRQENKRRKDCWFNVGSERNRFITNLKNEIGEFTYFNVIESTSKGYPHQHFLIITEKPQLVFSYLTEGKDPVTKKTKKRIDYLFYKKFRIEEMWKNGWVNIKSPGNYKNVIEYMFKDMLKSYTKEEKHQDRKTNLSLALTSVYNVRAYNLSQTKKTEFFENLLGKDFLSQESIIQKDLNAKISKYADGSWIILGITTLKVRKGLDPPDFLTTTLTDDEKARYIHVEINKQIPNLKEEREKKKKEGIKKLKNSLTFYCNCGLNVGEEHFDKEKECCIFCRDSKFKKLKQEFNKFTEKC